MGFWDAWIRGNIKRGQKARNAFFTATIKEYETKTAKVSLSWEIGKDFLEVLDEGGETPLPPYLARAAKPEDQVRYQTIFARAPGSVAAPTASLHFSEGILRELKGSHEVLPLTLHVGAGTFGPVKSERIIDHEMHAEIVEIPRSTLEALAQALQEERDVFCAGTTTLRALESAILLGERILREGVRELRPIEMNEAYEDWKRFPAHVALRALIEAHPSDPLRFETKLFLGPGARYSPVKGLLTNFHLPESTLLCLVAGFLGGDQWKRVYQEAISQKYRFYSYGDASLLFGANRSS